MPNPLRIEGPDPPPGWTARDVERWLIIPMRALREPHSALVAGGGNSLASLDANQPSATFDIMAFARTVLGKDSPKLRAVVTWARIMAGAGDPDVSIAEWCRESGWKERTFHRRRIAACEEIAWAKNRADAGP